MTRLRHRCGAVEVLCAIVMAFLATPALAQEAPALRPHHMTVGAGAAWMGGYDIGDSTAQLRGNGLGPSATPFNWFTAKSRVAWSVAPDFHIGVALSGSVAVDGGISYARPRVAVAISGDAEASSQELPGEQIDQYQIGAGVSWQIPTSFGNRLAPFVSAGGAYLRQLHEDRALGENGQVYHGGGGARYWLRGGDGASKALGVRIDGRVNFRRGGIDFDNQNRIYPSVSVMLFVGL